MRDTLILHLAMLARQCLVEEDASRMRKVHDALQERCRALGASYETVLRELAVPRLTAMVYSDERAREPS